MRVLLIPGFWLDASSWDDVLQPLVEAGHDVTALTLPGVESLDTDRRGITLRDHVNAVVAAVDAVEGSVVLVGHSGGGPVVQAAADARPDRVARVVYVDGIPTPEGSCINAELPVVDGEIPLPDWSFFDEADLVGLDEERRSEFRARAIPMPAQVATDPQRLSDPRRHDVPVTVVACEFTGEQISQWTADGEPWMAELAATREVEVIDLPTGHWPQFSRPHDLAAALVEALAE